MWQIHSVEHYLASKRKGILTPVTTPMILEDIVLSEISQTNTIQFHIYEVSEVVKFKETEQEGGYRGSGRYGREKIKGGGGSCGMHTEFQTWKMTKFWRSVAQDSEQT